MLSVYSVQFVLISNADVQKSYIFEHWNVRQKNVRISEDTNCFCEHCGLPFQVVTLVTKLLDGLAECHCTCLRLLWYA
jgi:hypothetical protein